MSLLWSKCIEFGTIFNITWEMNNDDYQRSMQQLSSLRDKDVYQVTILKITLEMNNNYDK